MMQHNLSNDGESEPIYESRHGSNTSDTLSSFWGDFQSFAKSLSQVTPRNDISDDDGEDMFSVYAWSTSATGKDQFLRERSHFNATEQENRRSRAGRTDEVVALVAQTERIVLSDDGSGEDMSLGARSARRSCRRSASKSSLSRSLGNVRGTISSIRGGRSQRRSPKSYSTSERSKSDDEGRVSYARRRQFRRARSKDSNRYNDHLSGDEEDVTSSDEVLSDDEGGIYSARGRRFPKSFSNTRPKSNDEGGVCYVRRQRFARSRSKDSDRYNDYLSDDDEDDDVASGDVVAYYLECRRNRKKNHYKTYSSPNEGFVHERAPLSEERCSSKSLYPAAARSQEMPCP